MSRLFVALDIPPAIGQQLESVRADIPGADWVKPSMYHVTLQFIGADIPGERLPAIISNLETVTVQPFILTFKGLERFRTPDWAGVVVAKALESPALTQLHHAVVTALSSIGFPGDDDVFQPHVTLVYLQQDSTDVDEAAARYCTQFADFETSAIFIDRFFVYETVETADGWEFRPRAEFRLGPAD
jgi:2'-5' RNA ligase